MFITITKPTRDNFLSSNDCLMPGYTGHCPTLKFRYGKRYGASTKEIIKEMGLRIRQPSKYREIDPVKDILDGGEFRPIERAKGQLSSQTRRSSPYIMGYTGYIPGMMFSFGKSYMEAASTSMKEFELKRMALESTKSFHANHRNYERKYKKIEQTYPDDKLERALMNLNQKYQYRDIHISPERPPVTGYTGHIPTIKSNDTSLSRTYHSAAKKGLYNLRRDRQSMRNGDHMSIPKTLPYQTPVY